MMHSKNYSTFQSQGLKNYDILETSHIWDIINLIFKKYYVIQSFALFKKSKSAASKKRNAFQTRTDI